jgi:hypothetical protein
MGRQQAAHACRHVAAQLHSMQWQWHGMAHGSSGCIISTVFQSIQDLPAKARTDPALLTR